MMKWVKEECEWFGQNQPVGFTELRWKQTLQDVAIMRLYFVKWLKVGHSLRQITSFIVNQSSLELDQNSI